MLEAGNFNDIPGFIVSIQAQAQHIVSQAGCTNTGLLFDINHIHRMCSGHNRRMISIEQTSDIMQEVTLLIPAPDNRFLLWRGINTHSSFHGNVPLRLKITLHRPVEFTAQNRLTPFF